MMFFLDVAHFCLSGLLEAKQWCALWTRNNYVCLFLAEV